MQMLVRLALLVGGGAMAAWPVDWKLLHPQGCVSDFANVADAASKQQIGSYCAAVERATGTRLALVTIASTEGEPVDDVAATIARARGVDDRGVLLLLAVRNRRTVVEVGRGLKPQLPAGINDTVLREMRPAFLRQHYGEALMAAAETLGEAVAKAKNARVGVSLPRRMRPTISDAIPWVLAVGAVVLVVCLSLYGRPRGYGGFGGHGILPGLWRRSSMSRSTWGSRGSGGFGGYDSGDSFGAFGGGDYGGGGASRDW